MAAMIGLSCLDSIQKTVFSWELDSLTLRQKWNPPQDRSQISGITLVSIDSKTMGNDPYIKYFQTLYSRKAAGYALRFFKRTTPQSILLDTSFNGGIHYQDLAGDNLLVDSVQGMSNVSSALLFEVKGSHDNDWNSYTPELQKLLLKQAVVVKGLEHFPTLKDNYSFDSLILPYRNLLESSMQFFSSSASGYKTNLDNKADDTQGFSRRWTPFSFYGGHAFPTFALGTMLKGTKRLTLAPNGQLTWPQGKLDLGPEGVPLIKWYGHGTVLEKQVYPEISFGDVVLSEMSLECQETPSQAMCSQINFPKKPRLSPAQFKNRHVVIGVVIPNYGDEHATIYSPKYPGVYIVANTLDNALHNDFIRPAPLWLNLFIFFALPLLLGATILRFRSSGLSLLMTISLSVGHFLLCVHAYNHWNLWIYAAYPIAAMLVCFTGVYVYRYVREHKKRQQMRSAFGKYVSPAVLQYIDQFPDRVKLGGERREMTFLFSDIRGFTNFSDQNPPEVVQVLLTQYFSTMNPIILHSYRGSINKLIGDAIMAYWGFPLENEDHAFLAVSAALAMRQAMLDWHKETGKMPINIGIGINTGEVVIGNIGSEDFMDFTVIGDAVNVASRLEGVNKEYGTTIIISGTTYALVKDRIQARSLGWVELKGKGSRVEVYEPLGLL